jgi:hypothetical protein
VRRELRQPTRAEWAQITSLRPVVRRIPAKLVRVFLRKDKPTTAPRPPFGPELTSNTQAGERESS